MFIDWILINKHLIPSMICFLVGLIFAILAPTLYQMRTNKVVIVDFLTAIRAYSVTEKKIMITGAVLILLGMASLFMIINKFGYYYFDSGTPTLLK